ncbi:hypothetical protein NPIL_417111 [Nephila pilipes]|uniref:Uncharacterized protein n=1 Tax=Nephila pilipes TaxID=299642 RepID=A0A8X6QTF4_NEPPI|nr:hypothetical protein NPIL_417111 [Nephila pilipes]
MGPHNDETNRKRIFGVRKKGELPPTPETSREMWKFRRAVQKIPIESLDTFRNQSARIAETIVKKQHYSTNSIKNSSFCPFSVQSRDSNKNSKYVQIPFKFSMQSRQCIYIRH